MSVTTDFLKNTVLKPGLQRLGTVVAASLLMGGDFACKHYNACGLVTPNGANLVVNYGIGVALLGVDLLVIELQRRGILPGMPKPTPAKLAAWKPASGDR